MKGLVIILLLLSFLVWVETLRCPNTIAKEPAKMDVFWVNLQRSVERKAFMLKHLEYYGLDPSNRINAFTPDRVIIPEQLSSAADCVTMLEPKAINATLLRRTANETNLQQAVLLSNCGRKKNKKREITVTISHLNTIREAIYNGNSSNPYALILEDDLQFSTEIDFSALIASAPANFGVLQLTTSNDYAVLQLWRVFQRHKLLWVRRKDHDDYWCAGAYIINKNIWKRYIDHIIVPISDHLFGVHLIAGYGKPSCTPSLCCKRGDFLHDNPVCIHSGRGYAADNYIFNVPYSDSYMATVPMVTGASYGNTSTLHQDHVSFHVGAFHRIDSQVGDMVSGVMSMPPYMNKNCIYNRTMISSAN